MYDSYSSDRTDYEITERLVDVGAIVRSKSRELARPKYMVVWFKTAYFRTVRGTVSVKDQTRVAWRGADVHHRQSQSCGQSRL